MHKRLTVLSLAVACAVLATSSAPLRARGQDRPRDAAAFAKTSPANGATRQALQVPLSWSASAPLRAGLSTASAGQVMPGRRKILRASGRTSTFRYGVDEARALRDAPQAMTFEFTYNAEFPAAARTALEAAANVWGGLLSSAQTIRVDAVWAPLEPGVLGSAQPFQFFRNFEGLPRAATWYPSALADKLRNTDGSPGDPDILADFSSGVEWFLGTSGTPPIGTYDFFTVALHELGHGLGFLSSANVVDLGDGPVGIRGIGNAPPFDPIVFDHGVLTGDGLAMNAAPDESVELLNLYQSDDVFFQGPNTFAANAGDGARLYAPFVWEPGSSMSHLRDLTYDATPNALMTHALDLGEVVHAPGPIAVGIMADSDWTAYVTYEVCFDATDNNLCDTGWANLDFARSTLLSDLAPGTTYYWQVRATSSLGGGPIEADGGGWFSFTTAEQTAPADFNGDGISEVAVYRVGTWFIRNAPAVPFGSTGDVPVPGDYNGNGQADIALFRPSTAEWLFPAAPTVQWGFTGDIPVPADYDGDGITDIAVWRTLGAGPAQWFVRNQFTIAHGKRGDIPLTGDWDRDGLADLGVFEPATGAWRILQSSTNYLTPIVRFWGVPGDQPVNGDFDGDSIEDFAVFRNGTWFILRSGDGYTTPETIEFGATGDVPIARMDLDADGASELVFFRTTDSTWHGRTLAGSVILDTSLEAAPFLTDNPSQVQFGLPGDIPVTQRPQIARVRPTDFDGDLRSDISVFRRSTGQWLTKLSSSNFQTSVARTWGMDGDARQPGDYDGDRRADVAVYTPSTGTWRVQLSSTNFTASFTVSWGVPGDIPTPDDFDGDGRTDIAVFRPGNNQWFVLRSSTNFTTSQSLAWGNGLPVTGDFDGDGKADFATFNAITSVWLIKLSGATFGPSVAKTFGLGSDQKLGEDFDGDGRADLVVFRRTTGTWFVQDALSGPSQTFFWGIADDVAEPHDYDGDRVADAAVYRFMAGQWYVRQSSNGATLAVQWGTPGNDDIPMLKSPPGGVSVSR